VKLEKAGQLFARAEVPIHNPDKLLKRAQKAFKHLCDRYPDLPVFDNDASLKFQRIE
jgi:hypothetical protein